MTNEPTPRFAAALAPETDAKLAFARALEIQRAEARAQLAAARAERDALSEALERNCVQYVQKQQAIIAERDALRADVARLRTALEDMLIAEMDARKSEGWTRSEVEPEPHWMAARAALAASAK